MSEINNMPNIGTKVDAIQPKKIEQPEVKPQPEETQAECPNCDIPAGLGVAGQSQVKQPENILTDIDFAKKHPELVEKADKYFDITLNGLLAKGEPDAYEKACQLTKAFTEEFAQQG
ncbi:MAG: hypothetical protein PHV37_07540 [Candidatus Gastranaerophilales bacterium]|nr:hypothetical protein [Candidatus Gastranaerophilales bacterium]